MLLLVIDDEYAKTKKEKYLNNLNVTEVLTASSIKEALTTIRSHKDENCSILVNIVLIEKIVTYIEELRNFAQQFPGIIILKVPSNEEYIALELLKDNIITEYFVERDNEEKELECLKRAFNVSVKKRKFNLASREFETTLKTLEMAIGK